MAKRVLVCPLDWGLGHATRCVPLIRDLRDAGAEVLIAASGRAAALLKQEFSELEVIDFPGYEIAYPSGSSMFFQMLWLVPKILSGIKRENSLLSEIIKNKKIDVVISDNRYGLWNENVKTVFITHQIKIRIPFLLKFLEPILFKINASYIRKFDECWIPDYSGAENLSGELSHTDTFPEHCYYIGPLSRFSFSNRNHKKYDLLFLLSGPEPQRSIFEKQILKQIKGLSLKSLLVRGTPGEADSIKSTSNCEIYSHLPTEKMQEAILQSDLIICRSGYSTVMDLAVLKGKAVFVPTPGQTEQVYLANKFKKEKIFYSESQSDFHLMRCMKESKSYNGIQVMSDGVSEKRTLIYRIQNLLSQ